ncbi:spermidine/putrescine ABC transporter substrate-binding protein [Bradyrhizobium icense]|uniref:Spermidine/putrescine ABC transporter substrate-binding protein n=2 Tax=Bradyrhizobium icense TaxID=1274631 RepID=A0A1B1UJR6_9BRAD|nr:spermidine/putrescine ABC transporter substrate-binding protein [Bradyrhizobium icense]
MRTSLMIAGALAAIGSAMSALMPLKPAFAAEELRIVSWGGALQAAQRKAFFEPFTKATGIKLKEDEYNGELGKIRAMVESKTVSWDVVGGFNDWVQLLCDEGVIEKLDWKRLGLDRSRFVGTYDCGVPAEMSGTAVAYDKDKLPNGPKTIGDLFDLQKFPGKRGLWKQPRGNLEWALIADGVPIKDVYKVLNTPEGVDRAFRKLDTIKKDVIWWTSGAQPPQLLADSQVVMTSAYTGRIYDANKNSGKHFEIMWDAATWGAGDVWVIPKGTPNLNNAYRFIAFASTPQAQANLSKYIDYGPSNKDAMPLIDPAILSHFGSSHPNTWAVDSAFWNVKGDELRQRFSAWLAK